MDKSRTELLIGQEALKRIEESFVTVVGTGGVGGHAVMALIRAGIEKIRLVDFDLVSSSNANRQVVANDRTIGRAKVDVLKEMILSINSNAKIETIAEKATKENVEEIVKDSNIVVDGIDLIEDKVELICYCKQKNIPIVSAMGAGNRYDLPEFKLMDIYKTHDDGLAKILRKKLKERGVNGLEVVASTSSPSRKGKPIASISYYPAVCGNVLASVVINKIIRGEI